MSEEENNLTVAPAELEAVVTAVEHTTRETQSGTELEVILISLEGRERPIEFAVFRNKDGKYKGQIQPFSPAGKFLQYMTKKGFDPTKLNSIVGYNFRFVERENNQGFRNWAPDWEHDPAPEMPQSEEVTLVKEANVETTNVIVDNKLSDDLKVIYDFISTKGDNGCPEADILREMKNNRPKMDKVLNGLMDEGYIYEIEDGLYGALVK